MTLVIVDCQYDFCDPNGALYVPGAQNALISICKLLLEQKFNKIIFTVDWHQVSDESFACNGGIWPTHCVQYSVGASIDWRLLMAVNNLDYTVMRKGTCPSKEEYGAFEDATYVYNDKKQICLHNHDSDLIFIDDEPIVICGVAGDYCVKETAKNLLQFNPSIYLEGTASIDDGSTLKNFIKENNLKSI